MGKLLRAELLELFFHEVESYIPEMQRCLDLLTKDNSSKVALEELYRYFHNIKGASSQVKLVKVSEVAKQLELFIEEKIELKQTVDQHALDNLVRVLDVLKTFAQAQDGSTEAEEVVLGEYAQTFGDSNNDDITHSEQVSRQIEIESLHSGLGAARRILPLLKEMAECLLPTANSVESVNEIYNRLSEAVSLIAAAVNKAGMPRQGELLHELDHLLDQVTQGRVKHQPEMSGLFCDFFQYLEVIYSLEQPEQDELVLRVDEQLALIYSVFGLSRGQQAEAAHMSIVEDLSLIHI